MPRSAWKVGQHRAAGRDGDIAELGFLSHAPSASNRPRTMMPQSKKYANRRAFAHSQLERKRAQLLVPCHAREKTRRAECRVQIFESSPRALVQKQQSAHRIAGDFGGYAGVLAEIRSIVTRYAAACFLDSRVQEPAAGRFNQGIGR